MPDDSNATWTSIVLAAGEGTRMRSTRPKVLHEIAGRTMVGWVIDAALEAGASRCIVVVGHQGDEVEKELATHFGARVETVVQRERRGTGDAVRCVIEHLDDLRGRVTVLYGDCPLVPSGVIRALIEETEAHGAECGLVTSSLDDPTGYGRIVRDEHDRVRRIVEHRDCTEDELANPEVNPGLYTFDAGFLRDAIGRLTPDNSQRQLYLTDVVELAAQRGVVIDVHAEMSDLRGVNDQRELAEAASTRRRRIAEALARSGVSVADLDALYVDAECVVEPGARLAPNVHLRGRCVVRSGASVDVGSVLTNVIVDQNAKVLPYTVATDSSIGAAAQVGPFSHLRPESELGPNSKVGNFSETKKTKLGEGSKVNHLSYVGDGLIGRKVNIGAGTIFCNYDGARKHTTTLEDEVFVGSNSQFIAPVTVERGAYVASGTTVTHDVPEDALAVSRTKQQNKEGYAARLRARLRRKGS